MSDHTYNFNITMTCGGCSGAVERVLKKLDGTCYFVPSESNMLLELRSFQIINPSRVTLLPNHKPSSSYAPSKLHSVDSLLPRPGVKSFDVSLDTQTASVVTEPSLEYTTVLEKIKKTGKKVNSAEADGQPQAV
jgi:copper chaperone